LPRRDPTIDHRAGRAAFSTDEEGPLAPTESCTPGGGRIARGEPGAILNIGATYAWTGGPGAAPSAAAKAGVANLVQSLSVEWAPDGIRINGLMPGNFPHDDQPEALRSLPGSEDLASRIPAQRVGELHELAWAACFLCSPFATYITGHNLVIDGANWLRRGLRFPVFEPVRDWSRSKKN